jgi:hypothetical protein
VHPEQATVVRAEIYVDEWGSDSHPVLLKCSDTRLYGVKGLLAAEAYMGRVLTNEQVAGRLGAATGAPVGVVTLVDLPATLVSAEPKLQHLTPGISHGCLYLGDNMGKRGIEHCGLPENRSRFARLAILYGLAGSSDDQFIYATTAPELVYSVDHGHFFGPSNPSWAIDSLNLAPAAAPNAQIVSTCGLTPDELRAAASLLHAITDARIEQIVAIPRTELGASQRPSASHLPRSSPAAAIACSTSPGHNAFSRGDLPCRPNTA